MQRSDMQICLTECCTCIHAQQEAEAKAVEEKKRAEEAAKAKAEEGKKIADAKKKAEQEKAAAELKAKQVLNNKLCHVNVNVRSCQ